MSTKKMSSNDHQQEPSVKYDARTILRFSGNAVDNARVQGDLIVGTVLRKSTSETDWEIPPHVALANLPTFDANDALDLNPKPRLKLEETAVEQFIRDYGLLHAKDVPEDARDLYTKPKSLPPDLHFQERFSEFLSAQKLLRQAWSGTVDFTEVEVNLQEGFEVSLWRRGELVVLTADLWKFISLLFVLDESSGKTGVCANPSCMAPYFIKERRTQKFCKAPLCMAYAARIYTQRWWDSGGKQQRAKQRKKKS
jgi:hypothetical protein